MEPFIIGPYRLAVGASTTRAFYDAHPLPWVTCGCSGCRNFVKAIKTLPPAVTEFFASLGLDPEKPAETMYYTGTADSISGGGWYHLCGESLDDAPWQAGSLFGEAVDITPDFSISFQKECWLLPEDFPRPCIQMEVEFLLPWLLEEPNDWI